MSAILFLLICSTISIYADVAIFEGENLNPTKSPKVGNISLSVPSSNGFTYSNGLYASGSGKTFVLTAEDAKISKVLITMNGTSNRFQSVDITGCSACNREGSVYTCEFSSPLSNIEFKNNSGSVTITKLEVTYDISSSAGGGNTDEELPNNDVCLTITKTSGSEETFTDGTVLYSVDNNGQIGNTKFTNGTINKNINGPCINDKRFAIKIPIEVNKLIIYGYNSSTRKISSVKVSNGTNNNKINYVTSNYELSITSQAPNYNYTFEIKFSNPIEENTYIWVEFDNAVYVHDICYTPISTDPPVGELSSYCISVYDPNNNKIWSGFERVGNSSECVLKDFVVPGKNGSYWPMYWVGENGAWTDVFSANATMADMPLLKKPERCTLGLAEGAIGTLHIWDDNKASGSNLHIKFDPAGYGMSWGQQGTNWTYLPFVMDETITSGTVYYTDFVTLPNLINWQYWVGFLGQNGGYVYSGVDNESSDTRGVSRTRDISNIKVKQTAEIENESRKWRSNNLSSADEGLYGKFRIWVNNSDDYNFFCHFVPYYRIVFNANYPEGNSPADTYSEYVSTEQSQTLTLSVPTAPNGYKFIGWKINNTGELITTDTYNLEYPTADITLYAQWEEIEEPDYCFDMTIKNSSYGTSISSGTSDVTQYFNSNSGGTLSFYCSGSRTITKDQGLQFNNDQDYLICTLPQGVLFSSNSVIKITVHTGNNTERGFKIVETNEEHKFPTKNALGTLTYIDNTNLVGESSFKLIRSGSVFLYSIIVEGCNSSDCEEPNVVFEAVNSPLSLDDDNLAATTKINFESDNTSKPTFEFLKDGEADTDARIDDESGEFVFKTTEPGEYVIKVKQVADGKYCSVEEEIAIVVADNRSKPDYCGDIIIANVDRTVGTESTIGGTIDSNIDTNNKKLDKNTYFGFTLNNGETFRAGDVFIINITTVADPVEKMGTMKIYADKGKTLLYESDNVGVVGEENRYVLPKSVEGKSSLYIYRGSGNDWNPVFSSIKVYRDCNPQPVDTVVIEGEDNINIGLPTVINATATTEAGELAINVEYQWYVNNVLQENETNDAFTFTPQESTKYTIVCKARNTFNAENEWKESNEFVIFPQEVCGDLISYRVNGGNSVKSISGVYASPSMSECKVKLSTSASENNTLDDYTGYKMNVDGCYIGVTLTSSTFKAGDEVSFFITNPSTVGDKQLYLYDDENGSKLLLTSSENKTNWVTFVLEQETSGVYLYRSSSNQNPFVAAVSVYRTCENNCYSPKLEWSKEEVIIDKNNADMSMLPELNNSDDLPIVYSSSNPQVATINTNGEVTLTNTLGTTIISATIEADEKGKYCEAVASYTLVVSCGGQLMITATQMPLVTYQLEEYRTVGTDNGTVRPYSADTHYPLFTITNSEENGDWDYDFSVKVVRGGTELITIEQSTVDWIRVDSEDGSVRKIGANYEALGQWINDLGLDLEEKDEIIVTAFSSTDCGELEVSVPIVITRNYSIAYIVSGEDGGDLFVCDPNNLDKFYTEFSDYYDITPVNAFAEYDYSNYEPYDLVVLTDYPNVTSSNTTDSQKKKIRDLADLVDRKPMLSFKAHMSALEEWQKKGFLQSASRPQNEAALEMQVLCFSHDIFDGVTWTDEENHIIKILDEAGVDGNTEKDNKTEKGLQGFPELATDNFINIATIDAGDDSKLITCCERQVEVKARMIVLSIFSGAMQHITEDGMVAIDKILEYLLLTDPVKVSDCSLIFDNGGEEKREDSGDKNWNNPANWTNNTVPSREHNVRIEADCVVDKKQDGSATIITNININDNYTLTINADATLETIGRVMTYTRKEGEAPTTNPVDLRSIDKASIITIKSDASNTGAFLHSHVSNPPYATVEMYSPARQDISGNQTLYYWSYVAIPITKAPIPENFYGAYTYQWDEGSIGWVRYGDGKTMEPYIGSALSQPEAKTFTLKGQLVPATTHEYTLTKSAQGGANMLGNSWTAPIHIAQLSEADFGEGLQQTIYIYNTGRDPKDSEGNANPTIGNDEGYKSTPGTWTAIPINVVSQSGYKGIKVIPAMQAFEVDFFEDAEQSEAKLTIDYNKAVRVEGSEEYNSPLHAPRRAAETIAPDMMRVSVGRDEKTLSTLWMLQDQSFTTDFNNGWEGYYFDGGMPTTNLWAYSQKGNMSVLAEPELDGVVLGFHAAKNDFYTFTFSWQGNDLYLNDSKEEKSTLITDYAQYSFYANEDDQENRFFISSVPYRSGVVTSVTDIVSVNGEWTINNPTQENLTINIFDALGRLMYQESTCQGIYQIPLPDAVQGVYMVVVEGQTTNIVKKIVR